jgi:hypothetical protein
MEANVADIQRPKLWSFRYRPFCLSATVCALLLASYLAMNAQANEAESFPPVAPEGESAAPTSPEFVDLCLANSAPAIGKGGWELGKQLLTQSSTWGTIWRADFKIPGNNSTLVNRVMCWQQPGDKLKVMFAIGQDVPPL